jgi:hypothetical protein
MATIRDNEKKTIRTVADLIKVLKTMPQDAIVAMGSDAECNEIHTVYTVANQGDIALIIPAHR